MSSMCINSDLLCFVCQATFHMMFLYWNICVYILFTCIYIHIVAKFYECFHIPGLSRSFRNSSELGKAERKRDGMIGSLNCGGSREIAICHSG